MGHISDLLQILHTHTSHREKKNPENFISIQQFENILEFGTLTLSLQSGKHF